MTDGKTKYVPYIGNSMKEYIQLDNGKYVKQTVKTTPLSVEITYDIISPLTWEEFYKRLKNDG